jgi:prepilin-type N-terminal cleavage/methylation domain-containing protein/prepilin-type processing-associated H-X9-DG protein
MCHPQQSVRRSAGGFTLIELLVVIAIIAVLAAVLFPVFAKARETAKRAACLGQIRQIGTAMKLYQDDWNGCFPTRVFNSTYGDAPPPWQYCDWVRVIIPYAKSRNIFSCPGAYKPQLAGAPPLKMALSFNEYIYRAGEGFSTDATIVSPKCTLLLADGRVNKLVHDWDDGWAPDKSLPAPYNIPSGMSRMKYADSEGQDNSDKAVRHDGSNVLFCDLHARVVKSNEYKAAGYPGWANAACREWPVIYPKSNPYY